MKHDPFKLARLRKLPETTLELTYADDAVLVVDLKPLVARHQSLSRLNDPVIFALARIADHGATVAWGDDDELELAADNLRARAIEQAGGVSHEFIWNWMHRNKLTLDEAAAALGLSRRMLAYYRSGEKPVPITVGYACLGWEKAKKAPAKAFAQAA